MGLSVGLSTGCVFRGANQSAPVTSDLRLLPGSDQLIFWFEAESGITLDAPMFSPGSSPAVTLSGNLAQALPIQIGIDGAGALGSGMTFWWAQDENGANRAAQHIPGVASYALGSTGIIANFNSGTYSAGSGDVYNSVVKEWEPIVGAPGASGFRLDNYTVTPSPGCIYEAHGLQGGIDRASIKMAPAMLGNQGLLGSFPAGERVPFHYFEVGEMTTLSSSSLLALFGWTSQSSSGSSVIDWLLTGVSSSPSNAWGCQRIATTGPAQRYNSDGTTGSLPAVKADLSPHVFEIDYDGTIATFRIDGFDIATGAWNGIVNSNRYTNGGVKLAGGAATAFASKRVASIAGYRPNLTADKAAIIRAAL